MCSVLRGCFQHCYVGLTLCDQLWAYLCRPLIVRRRDLCCISTSTAHMHPVSVHMPTPVFAESLGMVSPTRRLNALHSRPVIDIDQPDLQTFRSGTEQIQLGWNDAWVQQFQSLSRQASTLSPILGPCPSPTTNNPRKRKKGESRTVKQPEVLELRNPSMDDAAAGSHGAGEKEHEGPMDTPACLSAIAVDMPAFW